MYFSEDLKFRENNFKDILYISVSKYVTRRSNEKDIFYLLEIFSQCSDIMQ